MLKKHIITSLLFLSTVQITNAAQTTIEFELATLPNTNIEYTKGQIYEDYRARVYTGWARAPYEWRTLTRIKPLYSNWSSNFGEKTSIHKYFVENIASQKSKIESMIKQELLNEKDVNRVDYVQFANSPFTFTFGLDQNDITFSLRNLKIRVRARYNLSGSKELLCGDNAWGKLEATVSARGRVDLASGIANIQNINVSQSSDADCSRPLGKIFDSYIDSEVKDLLKDEIAKIVKPIVDQTISLYSPQDLFHSPAQSASSQLGFNIIDDGWNALKRYADGIQIGFTIGINAKGNGNHLLKFSLAQRKVEPYTTTKKVRKKITTRTRYGTSTTTKWVNEDVYHFNCPLCAGILRSYDVLPIQTGSRETFVGIPGRNGRVVEIPIYGKFAFKEIYYPYLNYSSDGSADIGDVASCVSHTGLASPYSVVNNTEFSIKNPIVD